MADTGALKPNFVIDPPQVETKAQPSEEEQQVFSISKTAGWKILDEFMQRQLDILELKNNEAVLGQSVNFEEIGKQTLVLILVKDFVKAIRDKVKYAQEAVEPDGNK